MKFRLLILSFIVLIVGNFPGRAQLVTDNVFLSGKWLQVAIAPNGSWGNTVTVPAGYSTRGGSTGGYTDPILLTPAGGLGMDFSYDQGHDGFATGTVPYYGAYFLPGTPFDGWSMQVAGVRSDAYYTDGPSGGFYNDAGGTLTGTMTSYTYTPGVVGLSTPSMMKGIWTGTAGVGSALHITQENRLDTLASHLVVTTKFVNTSSATMTGLYYFVTADPDNDELLSGGSFPTDNHIAYQGDAENRHEVWSIPNPGSHPDAFSGLATKDCRAKAMIYQSWPPSTVAGNHLDLVWAETATGMGGTYYDLYHTTTSQDIAYGLIFNLGDLRAGDSTVLSYAWIFADSTHIDTAFPGPRLVTLGVVHDSLDSVFACTLSGYGVVGNTFTADITGGDDKDWSLSHWTWAPAVGLSATTGTHVVVNISLLTGPTVYTITGTKDTAHGQCGRQKIFLLYVQPCFNATSNEPVCLNDTLKLYAHGDSTGATYRWFGPGGFVGFTQNTKRNPLMTMADTGWYTVVRTVGSSHDTARTHVMLKPVPVVTATSNGPICSGPPNTLVLTASPVLVGETFAWTGPGGFTAAISNPSITNPPYYYRGVYKVVTTLNGCMDSNTVTVIIDSTPAVPVVGSNSPVCSGHRDTLKLTATDVTPGVFYSWAGPSGFTSLLQNPTIPSPFVPASGVYTVTVTLSADGITCSNFNTVTVVIDSTPFPPVLGSNAPICSGNALLLNATSTAFSTYSWTGPNGFVSVLQNPSINPATTLATGTYSVTATLGACTSDTVTIYVVVDSTPEVPTASSNSPGPPSICERDTLLLYANDATAGVNYSWVGPNTFISTLQNPIIPNVTPAATGLYTVTAILGACSAATVINVNITPTPLLIVSSNSPVCTGVTDTLFLQATSNPGATFTWTGPFVFTSTLQNPFRTPAILEMDGVYEVTAFLNGCASLPVFDTVHIRPTPPSPMLKQLTFCQGFDAPYLDAYGDSILWYPSGNPLIGGTLTAPKVPTDNDTLLWYYVTQTRMGCTSKLDSFMVTINPKPVVTVNSSVGVCPHDTVILKAVDADPLDRYHWTPSRYLDDTTSATVIARPVNNMTYTVITTNKFNCYDTAVISVTVRSGALLELGDSITLYPGESVQLNPLTNCSSFSWFPPAGLSNAHVSDPLASPEISTMYTVRGVTDWGCKAVDSISIYVNPESLVSLPNAFTPGSSANNEFKILMRGVAKLNYFRIWDRWGVKVFETTNINKGWDGTYNGKNQPFGVYMYQVEAVTGTGRTFVKSGNVTLIR